VNTILATQFASWLIVSRCRGQVKNKAVRALHRRRLHEVHEHARKNGIDLGVGSAESYQTGVLIPAPFVQKLPSEETHVERNGQNIAVPDRSLVVKSLNFGKIHVQHSFLHKTLQLSLIHLTKVLF
jgi:hypothetical protein